MTTNIDLRDEPPMQEQPPPHVPPWVKPAPHEPTKTLRDEFAMAALPVLLAKHPADRVNAPVVAYKIADQMMEARK